MKKHNYLVLILILTLLVLNGMMFVYADPGPITGGIDIASAKIITQQQAQIHLLPNEPRYFKFIPAVSGQFTIKSDGANDSWGRLLDSSGNTMQEVDDGDDLNFKITDSFIGGQVYYLSIMDYVSDIDCTLDMGGMTFCPAIDSVVLQPGFYKNGDKFTLTVNFSSNVSVNTAGGPPRIPISIGSKNTYASYESGSGSSAIIFSYTVQAGDEDTDGSIAIGSDIDLNGASITDSTYGCDAYSWLQNILQNNDIYIDTVAPGVNITALCTTPAKVSPIPVQITFSEPVSGFDITDLSITGGTLGDFSGSGASYTVNATPAAQEGEIKVNIGAGAAADIAGNANTPASELSAGYDYIPPTATISYSTAAITNGNVKATLNPSESVTVTNNGGSAEYEFTDNGSFTFEFKDAAGNTGTATATVNYIDKTIPTVSATMSSDNADPARAKAGNTITVNITASEDIQPPTVLIAGQAADMGDSGDSDAKTWKATYLLKSGDPDGPVSFSLNFSDIAGNSDEITAVTSGGTVVLDNTSPTVAVTMLSDNANTSYAKTGDTITLSIAANEAIQLPAVTIAGHSAAVNDAGDSDEKTWKAEYIMQPGDTEGPVSFEINCSDLIGNAAAALTDVTSGTKVIFDNTAPTALVTMTSDGLNPIRAKAGDTITLNITADENIQSPSAKIAGHDAVINDAGDSDAKTWRATYTMQASDTAGAIPFSLELKDIIGNSPGAPITDITGGDIIIFDNDAPIASVVTILSDNTFTDYARAGSKITLNFTTSEEIQTPTVTIAGKAALVNNAGDSDAKTWQAEYVMSAADNEGTVTFALNFKDLAGNTAIQVTSATDGSEVTFDRTAPTVTVSTGVPAITNSDPIPLKIEISENAAGFDLSDIVVGNGTAANIQLAVTTTAAIAYTADIIPAGQGEVTVKIAAGAVQDSAGNNSAASNEITRKYDSIAPEIDDNNSMSVYNAGTNTLIVKFKEEVGIAPGGSALDISKFTVRKGLDSQTLTAGQSTAAIIDTDTITITLGGTDLAAVEGFPGGEGIDSVDVAAGGLTDIAGNANASDNGNLIATDLPPKLVNAEIVDKTHILVTLSENCTNIQKSNDGGFIVEETGNSAQVYIVSVIAKGTDNSHIILTVDDMSASGKEGITVKYSSGANGTVQDLTGNALATDNTGILAGPWDQIAPTANILLSSSSTNSTSIPVTITFSEAVTGFTGSDVTITNGTVGSLTGSGTTYNLTVNPTAQGLVTIAIAEAVAQDIAGNDNSAAGPVSIIYDNVSPSVSIASSAPEPVKDAPIPVDITFSEQVSDFTAGDVTISNGTGSLTGSGSNYTLLVTPTTQGAITVKVNAGVAHDAAGNANEVSNNLSRTFDSVQPTVVLTAASNPATASPFAITITFSKPVIGLTESDISVSNGHIENLTAVSVTTGGAIEYQARIVPTAQGDIEIIVNADSASDVAGNYNFASAPLIVYFDDTAPIITSAVLAPNNAYIDISFSEGVYGAGNGLTPLTADKLQLLFMQNGGSATAASISSIKKVGNPDGGVLTGGETAVRVFLSVTGVPRGVETIEIKPANASSIYNFAGLAMSAAQSTRTVNLADQSPKPSNNSSGSSSSNGSGNNTPDTPAQTSAEVLVNGQPVRAGISSTTVEGGKTVTTLQVDEKIMAKKLESEGNNAVITIPVKAKSQVIIGELNGQMVKDMEKKLAVVEVDTGDARYTLPAAEIKIDDISSELGANISLKDIKVKVQIAKPSAEEVKAAESTAKKGKFALVVAPVDFYVICTYGDKSVEVKHYNSYVERTIRIPAGVDSKKITTGVVVNSDGSVRHVPTKVTVVDDIYYAKINSLTNSTYTVIWNQVAFKDVENHWSKEIVNDMAARLITSGVSEDTYAPDRGITRAEFASIMVSALGLDKNEYDSDFKDVKASNWYYKAVSTAYKFGILGGYKDGSFKPDKIISRQEATVMLNNAMKLTGMSTVISKADTTAELKKFKDGNQVAEWSAQYTAVCLKNGIISGSNGYISPRKDMTRAEAAAMIRNVLEKAGLI